MSDFLKALLTTAVPLVVVSVVSMAGAAIEGFYYIWFAAALGVLIAGALAIRFYFRGKRQKASGMLAGIAIGIASLGMSCFANLQTILPFGFSRQPIHFLPRLVV